MRYVARATVVTVLAVFGAALLVLSVTMTTTVQLLATYAIKGTQGGVYGVTTDEEIAQQAVLYIASIPADGAPHTVPMPVTVVQYPASNGNPPFDESVAAGVAALEGDLAGDSAPVIYGFSQGAVVAGDYKRAWNANPVDGTVPAFYLTGNPNRPNGGQFTRSGEAATPTETAGATPGQITTYDIAGQYDPAADRPINPLNIFSAANTAAALYVHLNYPNANPDSNAVLQGTHGDTAYYLIPTYPIPLLVGLQSVPGLGPVLTDMLDPALRVLVESGYNRTINPGLPAAANPFYTPNPIAVGVNFVAGLVTGVGLGLQDIMGTRLTGSTPSYLTGPGAVYSIGGPPVTLPNQTPRETSDTEQKSSEPSIARLAGSKTDLSSVSVPETSEQTQVDSSEQTTSGAELPVAAETGPTPVTGVDAPGAANDVAGVGSAESDDVSPVAAETGGAPGTGISAQQTGQDGSGAGSMKPDESRSTRRGIRTPTSSSVRTAVESAVPRIRRVARPELPAVREPKSSPADAFKKPEARRSASAAAAGDGRRSASTPGPTRGHTGESTGRHHKRGAAA